MIYDTFVLVYLNALFGGAETLILRKAKWLIDNQYKVVIITVNGPMLDEYKQIGARVICISNVYQNIDFLTLYEFQNLASVLVDKLSRFNIKAIEGIDPVSGLIASWLAQIVKSKLLIGILHPSIYTKEWRSYLKKWDNTNSLYAINMACYDAHERRLGIHFENKEIIPVGIDKEHKESDMKFFITGETEINILTVARHDFDKIYIRGLIKSFDYIKEKYINAKLIIIGDGSYYRDFEKRAKRSKYSSSIIFTGNLRPHELIPYYEKCHIFLGMGTSALHASIHKKPTIIAYFRNESDEGPGYICDLPDDSFGEIIENWPLEKFHVQILRLLENQTLYNDIAKKCYDLVLMRYEINSVMKKWISLAENSNRFKQVLITNIEDSRQSDVKLCLKRMRFKMRKNEETVNDTIY